MAMVMGRDVVMAKDIKEIVEYAKAIMVTNAAEDMDINHKANNAEAPVMAKKAEVFRQRVQANDDAIPIPRHLYSHRAC